MKSGKRSSGNFVVCFFCLFSSSSFPSFLIENLGVGRGGGGVERKRRGLKERRKKKKKT